VSGRSEAATVHHRTCRKKQHGGVAEGGRDGMVVLSAPPVDSGRYNSQYEIRRSRCAPSTPRRSCILHRATEAETQAISEKFRGKTSELVMSQLIRTCEQANGNGQSRRRWKNTRRRRLARVRSTTPLEKANSQRRETES